MSWQLIDRQKRPLDPPANDNHLPADMHEPHLWVQEGRIAAIACHGFFEHAVAMLEHCLDYESTIVRYFKERERIPLVEISLFLAASF